MTGHICFIFLRWDVTLAKNNRISIVWSYITNTEMDHLYIE